MLLTVSHLYKRFNLEAGFFARFGRFVNAVNDISFSIGKNQSYGLAGESGCGKTTTARMLVRMYEADAGEILYHHENAPLNVAALRKDELMQYREKVRYVFQDPARSLNPRMSVYEVLVSGCRKPLRRRGINEKELREKAAAILEEAGLQAADLEKRPSEFSGGQRQRISIARALLMEPELLICDEVVSALDVSIQGQILNLLLDIREKRDMSFLFIAHDLKVACYFCDRIGVMYKGELMEEAPAANLYKEALHPYTRLLFSSAAGISQEEAHTEAQGHGEYGRNSEEAHAHQSNAPEPVRAFLEKNLHGVGQENLSLSNKGFRPQAQGRRERKGDSEVLISKSNSHGNAETQENNSLSSTSAPSRLCVMDSQEKASNSSCSFAPRCTRATERCFCEHPALCEVSSGHSIRCFNCAS